MRFPRPTVTRALAASIAGAVLLPMLLIACRGADRARAPAETPGTLAVETVERGTLQIVGLDTLGDSARVVALYPEPDGDAIAFTFADPARQIAAGLGLLDRQRGSAQLVWPDSVAAVWWSVGHQLSFQTGQTGAAGGTKAGGIHAVMDVHAETLRHLEDAHAAAPAAAASGPGAAAAALESAARAQATRYIDSLRVQPAGVPADGSTLRYTVTAVLPSPSPADSLAAFHVVARGAPAGERLNPAWYLLDLRGGGVAPLDSITGATGATDALPDRSAAWIDGARFVYAKGLVLYEGRVRRR